MLQSLNKDKQTSYCDNISSKGWRGSSLSSISRGLSSVEGPVSRFIDAGVVCKSSLVCLGGAQRLMDSGAFPSMPWTALDRPWYSRTVVCVHPMWPHGSLHQDKTCHPTRPDCCQVTSHTLPSLAWASRPRVLWAAATYWPDNGQ